MRGVGPPHPRAEGYRIVSYDANGPTPLQRVPAAVTWPTVPQALRITCDPSGGAVAVRGYVDGVEVVAATDPGGWGTYNHAAVVFGGTEGAAVRFAEVTAIVPESYPSMR